MSRTGLVAKGGLIALVLLAFVRAAPLAFALPGDLDPSFDPGTGANSYIVAVAPQSTGKIIVAGDFWMYNGVSRNWIARLNSNGSFDSAFNALIGTNGDVEALAIQPDDKILIGGGYFTDINGVNRHYLARLNADGSLDMGFNPGSGVDGKIRCFALQNDGKILVGGDFGTINGIARSYVARLNANGSVDNSFNPSAPPNNSVWSLALQTNGQVVIGGQFYALGSTTRTLIARLNSDGSLDQSFNVSISPSLFEYVDAIALQSSGKIIMAGSFTNVNSTPRTALARLNSDGSLDSSFNGIIAGFANTVLSCVAVQPDNKVFIAGSFASVNGNARTNFARLMPDGNLDTTFDSVRLDVNSILGLGLQPNRQVLIAGMFTNVDGAPRRYVARLLGDIPPAVAITQPPGDVNITAPINVFLSASASDDFSVTQVRLYGNAGLFASSNAATCNYTWLNVPVGTNLVTAVATDDSGLSTTSAPVRVIVQTALPQIALTSPTNGATFITSSSIPISAAASDADNSIARVELYCAPTASNASPVLLASITNPPFNYTWSGMATGAYTLTARAVDSYGPIVTSAPVSIVVNPPAPPIFQFNATNYSVDESNGSVTLTVLNNGDLGGSVNYTTIDSTAHGGSGYSGDYTIAQGSLLFAAGQHSTNLVIGIRDNFLSGPDIQFGVQLFGPSAGSLGSLSNSTVTIHENDVGGASNSLLTVVSPSAQPPTSGALTVTLNPSEAAGQWRFPWDLGWRSNGATAAALEAGNYLVQFRNVPNYLAFPPSLTVAVTNGGTTLATNQYLPALTQADTNHTGSITVNIGPNTPTGAGWRFIGESTYRPPNSSAAALLPDTYFIEFASVSQYSQPASRAVQVFGSQATVVSVNYLLASSWPSGASPPSAISPGLITDLADYPFGFSGQLHTDAGFGSGAVVRETVVLTAAHMVFNDATLSYVNQAYWSFQEEAGTFAPEPLAARGWYVLSGYAAQRTNDLQVGGYGIDQSSPQSRELDVAALYFLTPAARGGYGGFLTSDALPNPWLTGSNLKMLVGYPVDGSQYGDATIVLGKMYTTPAQPPSTPLTQASNDVYTASWFLSYPGSSGGPLYVKFNNNYFYPAGVYLGTLGSGQNSISVVRAITSDVANMINLASSLGDAGTNHTGGGVITLIAGAVSSANPAYVQVQLGPPAAVKAGAGWRLAGDGVYGSDPDYTRVVTTTNASLEFSTIDGWNAPAGQSVSISPGADHLNIISNVFYTVIPPLLIADKTRGIGLTGTTGTTYRIDYRTNLARGQWLPLKTNTLGPGFNAIAPWPPTNILPAAFYRAVWLP